ncbi:MAG: TonB-dependent receptor [Sphingobacteriales bacterium]|nr:TonB-dependent receptor [Sphingobacteriales bacterium]
MKYSFLFLLLLAGLLTGAQSSSSMLSDDSTRSIELREIQVSTTARSDRQRMIQFYRGNQSAGIEDILARLPEITLIRRGTYGMEPAIRSLSGGQINVLLDGMRIHGACTDKMDPATIYIEPVNLDEVQLQTGTQGFLYGASIGGTVNLKTATVPCHNTRKINGSVSSGYQSAAKSFYESLQLRYSSGKFAIHSSVTWRNSEAYRSGGGQRIPFSQYQKVNYSTTASYQLNERTLLKADYIGDHGWNIGYPALPMDVGYAVARIGSLSLQQNKPGQRMYQWTTKIYANQVRHYMDDTHRPNVPMHMDMPGRSLTWGLYTEGLMKLTRQQQVRVIADFSSTRLKASMTMYENGQPPMYMLTWPDNRKDQGGIGMNWKWRADSNWTLQSVIRMDLISTALTSQEAKEHIRILGVNNAGRLELLKNISVTAVRKLYPWLQSSLSLAYAERMPTATELYGFYLFNAQDGYDYLGNPKLAPERSLQGEWSLQVQGKKIRIKTSLFYQHIRDFISGSIDPSFSTMTIGAHGVKKFSALPDAHLTGVEASLLFKPVAALDFISTLRYTRGEDHSGDPLPMIAPLKSTSTIRYQFSRFFLQAETEAATAQKKISNKYGEDKTPGYLLLHVRSGFSFQLAGKKTDLQYGIENLLDKNYHEHLDWGNVKRPGRNVYVLLRVKFG